MSRSTNPVHTRRIGAWIVSGYVAVAAATLAVSGHRVLPLFEGIGPSPAYQWVHPPPQFGAGNITPQPAAADISFTAGKTGPAVAATADGQFVVNFGAGAFGAHDADTTVHAAITPLDPATLGALPPELAADGNAYRIQLAYRPSNTPVDLLAVAGDVIVTVPHPAHSLFYSADGQTWTKLSTQELGGASTVGSPFTRAGFYLVGAGVAALAPGGASKRLSTLVIAALVAGLAILLAAAPVSLRTIRQRWSRRRTAPRPRPGQRPTRPNRS